MEKRKKVYKKKEEEQKTLQRTSEGYYPKGKTRLGSQKIENHLERYSKQMINLINVTWSTPRLHILHFWENHSSQGEQTSLQLRACLIRSCLCKSYVLWLQVTGSTLKSLICKNKGLVTTALIASSYHQLSDILGQTLGLTWFLKKTLNLS